MKSDIVKRKIKIFIIGPQKNDPEIMSDPPVKYLENDKCDQINFPLPSYIYEYLRKKILFKSKSKTSTVDY